jgi:WD40 repeat protein
MHIRFMPSHALITCLIQYSIVARSLPLTGKILLGYLDTSRGACVGIRNPNAEFASNISACAISCDGGTAKIVWGTRASDSEVLFMNAPRAMDGGRRNAADVRRCDITDEHVGSGLDAQWVINASSAALGWPVVTASADGRIKLWDAKTVVCQWTSQRKSNVVIPNPCLKVTAIQTGAHGGCTKRSSNEKW